ncbi:16S rRNA (guanine(527)-N(7))-methyltransferase RsmG [Chloroflexota bacterium]
MEMLEREAAELGFSLTAQQLALFQIYYEEMVSWNRRTNLTAVTGYEDVQKKHFLDSLTVATLLRECSTPPWYVLDVGAGAGLPGLPLKVLMPREISLVLLEATGKKADFLKHVVARLGMADVEVIKGRAENLAHEAAYRERFDVVLSRALAPLPALAELTLPFCRVGGRSIAMKKGDIAAEVALAAEAVDVLGGGSAVVREVSTAVFDDNRYLVTVEKTSITPAKYPRRPGVPTRRPLLDKQARQ